MTSELLCKAKALNDQFCSVFTKENTFIYPVLPPTNCTTEKRPIRVSCKGVKKQLQGLKCDKAPGPDGIPPWILQMLHLKISPILTEIFQSSLYQATLPSKWKEANVHRVFKKEKREEPKNYRLISLTCISCKILEHIVHSLIMDFLESNNILVDNQRGFRQKHSTETQPLSTIHDISSALNEKKASHLAISDFTKAFDKVLRQRLLMKLHHYGITDPLNNWLRSFLTNRTQQTVCDGVSSPPQQVISGVPQGMVLGPLLFLFYVYDLPFGLECQSRLFSPLFIYSLPLLQIWTNFNLT